MTARDIRSLDIGMLRTFDALMRERSVSRAAARLFLSQPAVSASLGRLREAFSDPLFSRTAHGVEPTPRALALAPQVEKVLADIASLLDAQLPFEPAASNRIFRVAGSDHASRLVLPPLCRLLAQAASPVRVVWEPPSAGPLAERLHRGLLDVAVVARIHPPRDVRTQLLYEDHYVYATRHGHPQTGHAVTVDDFCRTPHVFLGYGTSALEDVIDETLTGLGRERLAQIAVNSFGQIAELLMHSDYAAVIASRVAATYAGVLQAHGMPFALPRYRMLLCWDARADNDAGVQWLRHQIAAVYALP